MQRDVTEIAPGVLVTTSRREATTSTIVVSGDEVLLIDPAWDPDELDGLAALVIGLRYRVRAGIATHAHHDHVLWHPAFGDAPRYASRRSADQALDHRGELLAALGPDWPQRLTPDVARLDADRRYLDALLNGKDPDDARRGNPGMAAVHDRLVAPARPL